MMAVMMAMMPPGVMTARFETMDLRRQIVDPRVRAVRVRGRTLRRGRRTISAGLRMLSGGTRSIRAALCPLSSGPSRLRRGIGRIGGSLSALHRSGRGAAAEHQSPRHKSGQGHSACKSPHQNLPNFRASSKTPNSMGSLLQQRGRPRSEVVTARANMVNIWQGVRFHGE